MKKPSTKYLNAADLILEADFWMAGLGHFNITREEIAAVIEMAINGNIESLKALYEELASERL